MNRYLMFGLARGGPGQAPQEGHVCSCLAQRGGKFWKALSRVGRAGKSGFDGNPGVLKRPMHVQPKNKHLPGT